VGIVRTRKGNIAAASTAERAINYFKPDVILFVGIAGGIKDVELGDVVASGKIYNYHSGKSGETFKPRPEVRMSDFGLEDRAIAEADKDDWLDRILITSTTEGSPTAQVAPIAAGEIVVADQRSDVYQFLREYYGDAVAVEMEGFGVLEAARTNKKVAAIVVRGISDLIDQKEESDAQGWQAIASAHASAFAFEILSKFRLPMEEEPLPFDQNFLGRDLAIREIKTYINQQKKVIFILAPSGAGKTTLAEKFFEFNKDCEIVLRTYISLNDNVPTTAEETLNELLTKLGVDASERSFEFQGNLDLLKKKLNGADYKIGILIDNFENVLKGDGSFRDDGYRDLLSAISLWSNRVVTLITSQAFPNYENDNNSINDRLEKYSLDKLSLEVWSDFFRNNEILFEKPVLQKIYNLFEGNAQMMSFLTGTIKSDYDRNLTEYVQSNKENITRGELISNHFNILKDKNKNAYKLLCYLGCYNYQQVPKRHVEYLAESVQRDQGSELISILENRSIIRDNVGIYYLHESFRSELQKRLKEDPELKKIHKALAALYNQDGMHHTDEPHRINASFEAFNHYYEAQEFEECYKVLLRILEADKDIENLRCSINLWHHMRRVIDACEKLSQNINNLHKAIILIPLGILYPEIGRTSDAINISKEIFNITEDPKLLGDNDEVVFAKVSVHLISARSYRIMGNFKLGMKTCKEAINLIENDRKTPKRKLNYWKGLSTYELGNIYLERAKLRESYPMRFMEALMAIYCIAVAAFLAIGVEKIREEMYKICKMVAYHLLRPTAMWMSLKSKVIALANAIIDRKEAERRRGVKKDKIIDDDYTKKFRIVYNIGQCFNLIAPPLASGLLEKSRDYLPETDYLNHAWVDIEMAFASSDDREKCYSNALDLQKRGYLSPLCSTSILFNYANFLYIQANGYAYAEAMNRYLDLKKILDSNLEFESLKMRNYYQICQIWSKLSQADKDSYRGRLNAKNVLMYLDECDLICRTIKLDFYKKRINDLRISISR
jgi:nucleoside phosphorylase